MTMSLLKRAKENGFSVLVVTLDTWSLAWRPADLDNAYVPFIKGVGNQIGFSDPVFRAKFEKDQGFKVEEDIVGASRAWIGDVFSGKPHTWEQIAFLRKNWNGPIVLKGIQHAEDARLALKAGCDGIIVSNHGGELAHHREKAKALKQAHFFLSDNAQDGRSMALSAHWTCSLRLWTQ